MKRSSKNRLTRRQLPLFPADTLHHKIARVVCRTETLPRKEFYEAWEVAKRIRRHFRGGRIVDLACGHGLLAHIMMILDDTSPSAICVDTMIPKNAAMLSLSIKKEWPRLNNRIHFKNLPVKEVDISPNDIVISVHACGKLTDDVMEKAISGRARLAVLPCCHDAHRCDTGGLLGWTDSALAIDATRAARLSSHGYKIITKTIPQDITPKNRLLMGYP